MKGTVSVGVVVFLSSTLLAQTVSTEDRPIQFDQVLRWANSLGNKIKDIAKRCTKEDEILKQYNQNADAAMFKPEELIAELSKTMKNYLTERKNLAWMAKMSLQAKEMETNSTTWADYNKYVQKNITDKNFVRYWNSAKMNDEAELAENNVIDETVNLTSVPSPNFNDIPVNTTYSVVHVPIPVYRRKPELLSRIKWSDIDPVYRGGRENGGPNIAWQLYCGKQGFMRFYPGRLWAKDPQVETDLFDCRNSEWYINAATNQKNIVILIDMSGSMLGQRFEIVKQSVEMIMETLTENDFFNIILFNDTVKFLADCFKDVTVQATLRNKWLMREKLTYASQSKIADFHAGLDQAFRTLLALPPFNITHRKDLPEGWQPGVDDIDLGHGNWMLISPEEAALIKNKTELGSEATDCNPAIMLLTDGATGKFESIFSQYNKKKTIRVFTFLVGDEATDFKEVQWMACENNGFMVQVQNLADVQEKVQDELAEAEIPPVWTGIYDDRLFRPGEWVTVRFWESNNEGMQEKKVYKSKPRDPQKLQLSTTVSFPVIVNSTFEGVVGVTVPMKELKQMAPSWRMGPKAYSFLVDNNGYAMYHPEHRPFDTTSTKGPKLKPNYNSIDILELEVLQENELNDNGTVAKQLTYNEALRTYLVNGNDSDKLTPGAGHITNDILVTMDAGGPESFMPVRRVYQQKNIYYFRGLEGTPFTLGLAVPSEGEYRIVPKITPTYGEAAGWFEGNNWRIHPDWRYCFMNDSDSEAKNSTRETGFRTYSQQIASMKGLPPRCKDRQDLVNLLLFDAQMTAYVDSQWVKAWKGDDEDGVHLVYFTSTSGLTRYADMRIEDIVYVPPTEEPPTTTTTTPAPTPPSNNTVEEEEEEEPKKERAEKEEEPEEAPDQPYLHYIHQRTRAADEDYYRRAMMFQDDRYVFNLNLETNVYVREYTSIHGTQENVSLLVAAGKALYLDAADGKGKAPIGVVGFEMLYDKLSKMVFDLSDNKCGAPGTGIRCYLLDEHGYVVYASNLTRADTLTENDDELGMTPAQRERRKRVNYKNLQKHTENPLGKFFADLASPEAKAMERFVDKKIYHRITYVDYQGVCYSRADVSYASMSSRLLSPFYNLLNVVHWLWHHLFYLMREFGFWGMIWNIITPTAEGYSPTFAGPASGLPCDKASYLYLLNQDLLGNEQDLEAANADVSTGNVCSHGNTCNLLLRAAPVPNTNLLFVAMHLSTSSIKVVKHECYTEACYAGYEGMRPNPEFFVVYNASDKIMRPYECKTEQRYRRKPPKCGRTGVNESLTHPPCSGTPRTVLVCSWTLPTLSLTLGILSRNFHF